MYKRHNIYNEKHRRVPSIRLKNWDYSASGWYFVTICTKNRKPIFGEIVNDQILLNDSGKFAEGCWLEIPRHFPHVTLDEFVVMPDHVHGIIVIETNADSDVGNKHVCSLRPSDFISTPWQTKLSGSLSSVVRGFKFGVAKYLHENGNNSFRWQKSFHDHIIRSEKSLLRIREYIRNNRFSRA